MAASIHQQGRKSTTEFVDEIIRRAGRLRRGCLCVCVLGKIDGNAAKLMSVIGLNLAAFGRVGCQPF